MFSLALKKKKKAIKNHDLSTSDKEYHEEPTTKKRKLSHSEPTTQEFNDMQPFFHNAHKEMQQIKLRAFYETRKAIILQEIEELNKELEDRNETISMLRKAIYDRRDFIQYLNEGTYTPIPEDLLLLWTQFEESTQLSN